MTAQPTQNGPARKRPAPTNRPEQMRFRPYVTGISILMIIVGAFYMAVNLGLGRQIAGAAVGMSLAGITLAVLSQMPAFYRWAGAPARSVRAGIAGAVARRAADDGQSAGDAAAVPQQRRGRRSRAAAVDDTGDRQVPDLRPAHALGPEFRYIILYGRHLHERGRDDVIAAMTEFWKTIDWDDDVPDDEIHAYRDSAEHVYNLAAQHPNYDENVTPDQLFSGTADPANPFPFIAEVESYHHMIAVMAALMLVRQPSKVSTDDVDIIMDPWTRLRQPYRLVDTIFKPNDKGEYITVEAQPAPKVSAAPVIDPTNGAAPPVGNFDDALAAHVRAAPPAPPQAAAAPAAPPASPARPALEPTEILPADKHAEPARDDVADPTADQVVHATGLVISGQLGSTQMLMRKMRIDMAVARKVMHRLFLHGVVGEPKNDLAAPRDVLVPVAELEETVEFVREREAEREARTGR